jgi:hypothetical protein
VSKGACADARFFCRPCSLRRALCGRLMQPSDTPQLNARRARPDRRSPDEHGRRRRACARRVSRLHASSKGRLHASVHCLFQARRRDVRRSTSRDANNSSRRRRACAPLHGLTQRLRGSTCLYAKAKQYPCTCWTIPSSAIARATCCRAARRLRRSSVLGPSFMVRSRSFVHGARASHQGPRTKDDRGPRTDQGPRTKDQGPSRVPVY